MESKCEAHNLGGRHANSNKNLGTKLSQTIFSSSYEHYSYDFYLTNEYPEASLVTCVFCVLEGEGGKIRLTKNYRGWELPGGHIEEGEDFETALKREMREEIGVEASDFSLVGYKKITNFKKTANKAGGYYPFPHSYILFYTGVSKGEKSPDFTFVYDETEASGLFSEQEALEIIESENTREILKSILATKK